MASVHEQLSEQFYRWESSGRGWKVHSEPVTPEPPFRPFPGHFLPTAPQLDDGRRPSAISSFIQRLSGKPGNDATTPPPIPEQEDEPEPTVLIRTPLVELQTALPAKLDISRESFDPFLSNISSCRQPVVFELVGIHGQVTAQFAASDQDIHQVHRQLQAHFSDAVFVRREGTLEEAWNESSGIEAFAVEFGFEREFMLPLATGKIDPFVGIVAALADLPPGDFGLFQVIFEPAQHPWSESIVRSVTHADGKPFFVNSPELAEGARAKTARPLYAAVVRVMVRTEDRHRSVQLACNLAGSLRVFAKPQGNALVPLSNEHYPFEDHIQDVLLRQSRRSGMLLNSDELFGFVHLPSSAVRSPALMRDGCKTKAAPAAVRQSTGLLLGENEHAGEIVPVFISPDQRVRHTHIIGASGTGKSTLLFNLIQQDIQRGDGVAVLDPHGDLIDRILGVIPERRHQDVVVVDLADTEFPIGFNILSAHSDTEKILIASDLVSVFRRLSTSWGDQMDAVLQNAILAIMENSQGGNLADLRRFLIEPAFRAEFLKTVTDPEIVYYWINVFPQLGGGKSIGSLLTRLQDFFARKPIRNMVSQRENKLDFAGIMDSGKILLAKLPEGMTGAENTHLLGTLLISKFQQIAMSRQEQAISARRDFWLYIDEFDHFITPSMAGILKGSRKYRLGLTLAHQELHQLQRDPKVASAVATHPCTRIVFRVGDDDAKRLAEGFESFDAQSLRNLEKFHAIARVERGDFDFNLRVSPLKPMDEGCAAANRNAVVAMSRARYATPRAEVEAALMAGLRREDGNPGAPLPKREETKAAKVPKPAMPGSPTTVQPTAPEAGPPQPTAPTIATRIAPDAAESETGQHTAIKDTLGAEAESLDYTVSYEELFPAIQARADIVLRRGRQTVICQVTVTTQVEFEAESVRKFLKGGFTRIAVISLNRKKLNLIQQAVGGGADVTAKVGYYSPEEFVSRLYDWAGEDPEGGLVERGKPHRQKFDFGATQITGSERTQREREMLQSIKEAMKRKPDA